MVANQIQYPPAKRKQLKHSFKCIWSTNKTIQTKKKFNKRIRVNNITTWLALMLSHLVLCKALYFNLIRVSVCLLYVCLSVCMCVCVCVRSEALLSKLVGMEAVPSSRIAFSIPTKQNYSYLLAQWILQNVCSIYDINRSTTYRSCFH